MEVSIGKIEEEEYVRKFFSEILKLNKRLGQLSNTDPKILPTDQSMNMVLTKNRELTKEIASPKKLIPGVESKDFTGERMQGTK